LRPHEREQIAEAGVAAVLSNEASRRGFGSGVRMQEQGFDVRGGGVMEDIAGDIRLALRILRKTPVKTAALAATVALGIGINTAVFSVMKVVLDPLPFTNAKDLMVIHQVSKGASEGVSYPNFEDWRAASRSFEAMAVYAADSSTLTESGLGRRVSGAVVSANLFHLVGLTAGLLLMASSARFLSGWLYQTSPLDAPSPACASAVLMAVAVVACWAPARRATRVSPMTSLRGESHRSALFPREGRGKATTRRCRDGL
jgi:hypothetical protein